MTVAPSRPVPFVERVRIENYKSIAECDVTLGPLTVLLGLNASGKSNFLDALRFVVDAVEKSPEQAVLDRGGQDSVVTRIPELARHLTIELSLHLGAADRKSAAKVTYGFELHFGEQPSRGLVEVAREWCRIEADGDSPGYSVVRGVAQDRENGAELGRVVEPGQLWLGVAATRSQWFRDLMLALRGMSFHALDPTVMRVVAHNSEGTSLGRSGERLGDVLRVLAEGFPAAKQRIDDYLAAIVPGALGIDQLSVADYSTVQLRMADDATGRVVRFDADAMSDGTLRAAGLLAALFQPDSLVGYETLICVDEPELGLHPAAAGMLFDALTEASQHVQVVVATQSGDLLDRKDFDVSWSRIVEMQDGLTAISEVDDGVREVVARKLATVGELLRANQLTPLPVRRYGSE
jgi:predicted ATPase